VKRRARCASPASVEDRYLVGDRAPDTDRDGAACEALANGYAAFTEFSESRCHATEVIVRPSG